MKNKRQYIVIVLIIFAIILLDQIIKAIMISNNNEITIFDGVLALNYNENTGIAFGIGNKNIIGVIFTDILVISILLRFLIRQIQNMNCMSRISLSFIIAGGISNFIDRIIRGKVIDYIDISKIINEFPIFNIADIFIVVGFIIFVIIVGIDLIKLKQRN